MNRLTINCLMTALLAMLAEVVLASPTQPQSTGKAAVGGTATKQDAVEKSDSGGRKPVVLVVGASGSVGRLAVAEAFKRGYETRALVRDPAQAKLFPEGVKTVVGDLTRAETLPEAVNGITGIIFTHGISGNNARGAEDVNYGAVRNVLSVLNESAHIALMTTVGVTKPTVGHDWKRRGERLVRASGLPYTVVRPGWFDYNSDDQHRLVMRQGDTHWAGSPSDGVVSRAQIADVLVASLTSPSANRKTFELVAEQGAAQTDLDPLFSALPTDTASDHDAIGDKPNLPLTDEPERVIQDLDDIRRKFN
ncbi:MULTISPECIES: SDR family oxidoreductase [Stutzerimonas stutzeri subgroup]|uniref:NAD-dependent epimerase/dehydratase n=1 Tax=Stutzerimonas stutzeri CCUG 29243 TaxID=1196835 RepID=I4CXJ0_STUST|nr:MULTISPECIES: SDR family oxidoreductase [Stutzerimonas stutzeri subgroup]AFM34797.1 NAD-dependent epimerase/dehydratase [Stutzerimonas stutzeri CCUG 29243]MCQ2040732.1 SDR family oxidoreductase [Stutzerimonas kunmingensis]